MDSEKILYIIVDSPVGEFVAGVTSKGCCVFEFHDRGGFDRIKNRLEKRYKVGMEPGTSPMLERMVSQVREYFTGERQEFSLPFDLKGTQFETSVWNELLKWLPDSTVEDETESEMIEKDVSAETAALLDLFARVLEENRRTLPLSRVAARHPLPD